MNVSKAGMAWLGSISKLSPIDGADRIQRADVICGRGGAWSGVVGKELAESDQVVVFLPDAVVPEHQATAFMSKHNWRVRMMRLRGCPSEVLIVPSVAFDEVSSSPLGSDVTEILGVLKYEKEIPLSIDRKSVV